MRTTDSAHLLGANRSIRLAVSPRVSERVPARKATTKVQHTVLAPFVFQELLDPRVTRRAVFTTKRGRCGCRVGVPVGSDAAVQ